MISTSERAMWAGFAASGPGQRQFHAAMLRSLWHRPTVLQGQAGAVKQIQASKKKIREGRCTLEFLSWATRLMSLCTLNA